MQKYLIPFENETSEGSWISAGSGDYLYKKSGSGPQPDQNASSRNRKKHLASAVGLMVNGVLAIVFGILWISLKCEISESGVPVWAGLWFIGSGILGVAAMKTPDNRCLMKTYVIFLAIDMLFGFNVVIIGGVAAPAEKPSYDSYALRVTIDAILVLLGCAGCIIALICIILSSNVVCNSCLIDKEIKSADGTYLSVLVVSKGSNTSGNNYKVFLPLDETNCRRSSIGQLICGMSCLVFGVGWMALECAYSETASALYFGVFFVLTGCLGYFATKKPYNTCLLIAYTVFSAFCFLYALSLSAVAAIAALKEHEKQISVAVLISFDVILAVVALVEICLAVWSIVLVSDVVCGSCSRTKNPYEEERHVGSKTDQSTSPTGSSSVFVVRGIEKQASAQSVQSTSTPSLNPL